MKQSITQGVIKMSGCALLILALSGSAFAKGGEVGNGGDIFLCPNSKSVLVDIYEADAERGIKLDLGPPRLALFSKVDMALKRLARISPIRAKMYSDQAHNFFSDAALISGAQLTPIQDVYNWATPDGCQLQQIAVQRVPQFPQDKRYLINKDLWNSIDDDSKAALILHEVIYREAIDLGFTNSSSVRYFNSLIFSHELDQTTPKDFVGTLRSLPFKVYEVNGTQFELNDIPSQIGYYPNGQIAGVLSRVWNDSLGKKIDAEYSQGYPCGVGFDASGNVINATNASITLTSSFSPMTVGGEFTFGKDWSISKVENAILSTSPSDNPNIRIPVENLDPSNFDQDGKITHANWIVDTMNGAPGLMHLYNGDLSRPLLLDSKPVRVEFSSSGMIKNIHTDGATKLYLRPGQGGSADAFNELWCSDIQLAEGEVLLSISNLNQDFYFTYGLMDAISGQKIAIVFMKGTPLKFQTGPSAMLIDTGTLGKDVTLPVDLDGKTQLFAAGTVVHFDGNGLVVPALTR